MLEPDKGRNSPIFMCHCNIHELLDGYTMSCYCILVRGCNINPLREWEADQGRFYLGFLVLGEKIRSIGG